MALQGTVTAYLLNVRNAPSLSGKAFTQIKRDTVVQILEQPNNEWVKIQLADGRSGYVAVAYLKIEEIITEPDPAPDPTPEPSPSTFKVSITASTLNVREGTGTDNAIIGRLYSNDIVEVFETLGDWYRIDFHGKTGYIHGGFTKQVTEPEPTPTPNPTPSTFQVAITTRSLNVRAGTSTNHAVLGGLKRDDVVEVLETLGDWYRIDFQGQDGFIHSDYTTHVYQPEPEPAVDFLIHEPSLVNAALKPSKVIPRYNLEADSAQDIVARIWNDYGGLVGVLANYLNVPIATMVAVLAAESGGRPYGNDGRLKIRFEVHIFHDFWGKLNQAQFDNHFKFDGWQDHQFRTNVNEAFVYFHNNQVAEHEVLAFARALDNEAALKSISMGMPQIMGFNHAQLGYGNAQDMYDAFVASVSTQILGMFDFVRSSSTETIPALRNEDYEGFASFYNGQGNAETYGNIIASYVGIYNELIPSATDPSDIPDIPPIDVIPVPSPDLLAVPTVFLNFRDAPNGSRIVSVLKKNIPVTILENKDSALQKFGQYGQWMYLENSVGQKGYAAAWLLEPMYLLSQDHVNEYIDQIPDYALPAGYHNLWANQEKLGLPNRFDRLPFEISNQTDLVNLQVNGFGPNTFALWNWQNYYRNTAGMHNGLDYILKTGTPIVAVSDGVIIKNWIFLADSDEITTTLWCFLPEQYRDSRGRRMMSNVLVAYGHLADNSQREHREVVKAGDIIAMGGAPVGQADNAHLHLELHLLQGDTNLPFGANRQLLSLYKRPQPMDNNTPHNPLLFFTPRVINYHRRQGDAVGFLSQYPDYPNASMLKAADVHHLSGLNQLTLAYYRYGVESVWKRPASGAWSVGIVSTDMLTERIENIAAFEPYEASFLD